MKKPKLFRWALWWGLGTMVACLAIIVIDALLTMGDSPASDDLAGPMYNVIYRLIYQFGIWPIMIYIGVIGPVFEEICFRLWGDGKRWTGYTSVILISLWGLTIGWWVGLLTLAAGIAIMIVLRNDRAKRLFAMMMLSTLLFALAHIGNYDMSEGFFMFAVSLLHKAGMGLLASYLVINHNILWSMGVHILNNSLMAALLGFGFDMAAQKATTIETEECTVTLQPILTKSQMPDTYTTGWPTDSTYCNIGTTADAAYQLYNFNHPYYSDTVGMPFYNCAWAEYPKVSIDVVMHGGSRDFNAAVELMLREGWIAIDTLSGAERDTIHFRSTYNPLSGL